jgi:hypothetical protein
MVNQGLQQRPRSAALKWGTGILFVLTGIYLFGLINLIYLIQVGFEVPFLLGDFIAFPLALAAELFLVNRVSAQVLNHTTTFIDIIALFTVLAVELFRVNQVLAQVLSYTTTFSHTPNSPLLTFLLTNFSPP